MPGYLVWSLLLSVGLTTLIDVIIRAFRPANHPKRLLEEVLARRVERGSGSSPTMRLAREAGAVVRIGDVRRQRCRVTRCGQRHRGRGTGIWPRALRRSWCP